jgi:hypothetical protein
MGVKLKYFAPLLAAGATVAAITVAPIAVAAPSQAGGGVTASGDSTQVQQSCVSLGGTQSQCQSPGNAQVYDAPPQVDYYPYGGGGT